MKRSKTIIYILIGIIIILIIVLIIKKYYNSSNFPRKEELEYAKKTNSDTVGWIYIPKTNINYPIMWKEDNYYHNHNLSKNLSTSGSVYSLYSKIGKNIVISGHNSRSTMTKLNWLHNIKDVNLGLKKSCYEKNDLILSKEKMPNFDNKEDRIWYVSIFDLIAKWEIWSMYETEETESIETLYYNIWNSKNNNKILELNEEETKLWITTQLSKSQYNFSIIPGVNDQFLTVFTCGCQYYDYGGNSKLYFFLRKI